MANEDARFTLDDRVNDMLARLTGRHQDSTLLRTWITIYAERAQVLEDVIRDIRTSILFAIDTAVGIQLDQIGSILVLPRDERDDDEYIVLLRTQALLVLPERRTQRRLMEIVRSLSDTDMGTIGYTQFNPKSFQVTVGTTSIEDLASWIPILRRTRPATYNMLILWYTAGHLTYQDGTIPIEIPVPGMDVSGYSDGSLTISESWGGYSGYVPMP